MSESKYSFYKKIKITALILIIIVYNLGSFVYNNLHFINPVKVDTYLNTVKIETPNHENTETKKLTYRSYAKNKSKKPVDFRIIYTKDEGDDWYTYIDILPEEHVTEAFHLEPNESIEFKSELTIRSNDNRLITSYFDDLKVKVEVIKEIENSKNVF